MSTSTKDAPFCNSSERGMAAIPMVLGLLVLVTFIGVGSMRMFTQESKSSISKGSGIHLEQLTRMGLESSFTLLRSMGSVTNLDGTVFTVGGGTDTKTFNVTNCNYFPRTDDVKLPSGTSDSALVNSGTATCLTARPNHPNLSPTQSNRYMAASPTGADIYSDTNLAPATSTNFRSVFPWVRYRDSQSIMNGQYGADENIQTQINQCGLSSQFIASSTTAAAPIQRWRYLQEMDGLGESWINLGESTMNLYANGLTLEAWVWMESNANARRTWQRLFDIGRGRSDSNIVFAYKNDTEKLALHIYRKGSCSNNTSSVHQTGDCGKLAFNAFDDAQQIGVPTNEGLSVKDLWYYVALTVDPASVANPRLKVYTKCARTELLTNPNTTSSNSWCTPASGDGTSDDVSPNWKSLYLRRDVAMWNRSLNVTTQDLRNPHDNAQAWVEQNNFAAFRKTFVGKSHWTDDDFKGKMREVRVWDRPLSADELDQPIGTSFTPNTTTSSIISNTARKESMRISPLYKFGSDRMLYFTVKETDNTFTNTWRLVSCAWNHQTSQRKTQSLRFRVLGDERPEVVEYLPY